MKPELRIVSHNFQKKPIHIAVHESDIWVQVDKEKPIPLEWKIAWGEMMEKYQSDTILPLTTIFIRKENFMSISEPFKHWYNEYLQPLLEHDQKYLTTLNAHQLHTDFVELKLMMLNAHTKTVENAIEKVKELKESAESIYDWLDGNDEFC